MLQWFKQYAENILSALPQNRLLALDVFRGLTITAMVLVNNPGSWSYVYSPMLHAKWHGYTPTDLIFPFFVFIVGISISIVLTREIQKGTNRIALVKSAAVRAIKLCLLGLFLAVFYFNIHDANYSWLQDQVFDVRVLGVLQRLGLVFLMTFVLVLFFKPLARWVWLFGLLVGYWLVMAYLPYSDANGEMYVGLFQHGNSFAAWLDDRILGASHSYYKTAMPFAFDPEGILSTLPAVASALTGVFTGSLLINKDVQLADKVKKLVSCGLLSLALGYAWSTIFPINKALWTSSFVLVTTGWAMLLLAALIWLIDMRGKKLWSAPFVVFGANAIFFYMFSGVLARIFLMIPVQNGSFKGWLFTDVFQPVFGNLNGSLAYAISFLMVCYVSTHWLYKKQIFFKV